VLALLSQAAQQHVEVEQATGVDVLHGEGERDQRARATSLPKLLLSLPPTDARRAVRDGRSRRALLVLVDGVHLY